MERGYIYKITCLLTGKLYIGQTLRTIEKRWKRHIRDSKKGSDHKFHRAIRKYGEENFLVEELLAVSAPTKKELKSQLDSLELNISAVSILGRKVIIQPMVVRVWLEEFV